MRERARTTAGEQPTVFSLKSRRSFAARPSFGALYGARPRTALRIGIMKSAPAWTNIFGTAASLAHLYGARMRLKPFSSGHRRNHRREPLQTGRRNFLRAATFHKVRDAQAAAGARPSRRR